MWHLKTEFEPRVHSLSTCVVRQELSLDVGHPDVKTRNVRICVLHCKVQGTSVAELFCSLTCQLGEAFLFVCLFHFCLFPLDRVSPCSSGWP